MAPTIFPELYESSNLCSFRNKLTVDRQTKRQITRERKIGFFKRSTIFSKRAKYIPCKDSRKIKISTTKISALKQRTFPRIQRVVLSTFDFLRFLVNLGKLPSASLIYTQKTLGEPFFALTLFHIQMLYFSRRQFRSQRIKCESQFKFHSILSTALVILLEYQSIELKILENIGKLGAVRCIILCNFALSNLPQTHKNPQSAGNRR